jgi:hypothetical protein
MDRFQRPSKRKARRRNMRQSVIVVAIGALSALGLILAKDFVAERLRIAAASVPSNEIYTGSILYTPQEGTDCHQVLFNNQSGQFSDNGYVDCARAAYRGGPKGPPIQWSTARAHVISSGFRDR